MLLLTGLQEWVLTAERVDLVTANKEGLASFPGPYRDFDLSPPRYLWR